LVFKTGQFLCKTKPQLLT